MRPHSRGLFSPEFLKFVVPRKTEGAGNAGRWPHPQASWAEKESAHKSVQVSRNIRHSLRNGLRLTSRSRRSTGLVSLRPPGLLTRGLIPASGDHDHTTSPSASTRIVCAPPRPSHPAPRVVTIGRTSLVLGRGGLSKPYLPIFGKRNIFAKRA